MLALGCILTSELFSLSILDKDKLAYLSFMGFLHFFERSFLGFYLCDVFGVDDGKNSILYIFVSPRKIVPYDNRNDKVWCKLEAERVARAQFVWSFLLLFSYIRFFFLSVFQLPLRLSNPSVSHVFLFSLSNLIEGLWRFSIQEIAFIQKNAWSRKWPVNMVLPWGRLRWLHVIMEIGKNINLFSICTYTCTCRFFSVT